MSCVNFTVIPDSISDLKLNIAHLSYGVSPICNSRSTKTQTEYMPNNGKVWMRHRWLGNDTINLTTFLTFGVVGYVEKYALTLQRYHSLSPGAHQYPTHHHLPQSLK